MAKSIPSKISKNLCIILLHKYIPTKVSRLGNYLSKITKKRLVKVLHERTQTPNSVLVQKLYLKSRKVALSFVINLPTLYTISKVLILTKIYITNNNYKIYSKENKKHIANGFFFYYYFSIKFI